MGIALLLTGIGFLVLTLRLLVPRTATEKAPVETAVPAASVIHAVPRPWAPTAHSAFPA